MNALEKFIKKQNLILTISETVKPAKKSAGFLISSLHTNYQSLLIEKKIFALLLV